MNPLANAHSRLSVATEMSSASAASFSVNPHKKRSSTISLARRADNTARLWDLTTKQTLITFDGHSNEVFEAVFSPDEKRIATASNDHTIKIWNAETGQDLLTLEDHKDQVWSVAFSPDGQTLASGSWDRTARLWRAFSEAEARTRIK
jgi:WD40 repeat protein